MNAERFSQIVVVAAGSTLGYVVSNYLYERGITGWQWFGASLLALTLTSALFPNVPLSGNVLGVGYNPDILPSADTPKKNAGTP